LKEIDGVLCEPVEYLIIDVPEEFMALSWKNWEAARPKW